MSATFVVDNATPAIRRLSARISNPIPGLLIAGRAVSNLLKSHFQHKDESEPNKLGGTRTHYWQGVKRAVNVPKQTGAAQVTVSISHPSFMQKVHGGKITAKRVSMLTIPMRAEAHGRAASVLERALGIKLFVVTKFGRAYLAGRGANKSNALRIYYALKRSVNQRPDPTALPPEEKINEAATKGFGDWVLRKGTP